MMDLAKGEFFKKYGQLEDMGVSLNGGTQPPLVYHRFSY